MKLTQSILLAAASFNLAIGAPIKENPSRAIAAKDVVRKAIDNNPYILDNLDQSVAAEGNATPVRLRSLIDLLKRSNRKRYQYKDTPRRRSVDKRYEYGDTPALQSVEDLSKRYQYKDTPRRRSVDKRYKYRDTPALQSVEDLSKRYEYGDTPALRSVEDLSER